MYLKSILDQIAKILFLHFFATFYIEIAVRRSKSWNWNMRETPSEMHMHDMVTIDTVDYEIVGGREGLLKSPPPRIVNLLEYPDRIGLTIAGIRNLMLTS